MKRKLIWLDEVIDQEAIRIIREKYGCETDSAVMRLALRTLASSPTLQIQRPETRKGNPQDE